MDVHSHDLDGHGALHVHIYVYMHLEVKMVCGVAAVPTRTLRWRCVVW